MTRSRQEISVEFSDRDLRGVMPAADPRMSRRRRVREAGRRGIPCHYCRRQTVEPNSIEARHAPDRTATFDHTVPESLGGTRGVIACLECNGVKGATPYAAFLAFMETDPPRENRTKLYLEFVYDLMLDGLEFRKKEGDRDSEQ